MTWSRLKIKDFNLDFLKIDKKSYKNIGIYYIGYITMKDSDYVKNDSVNSLYLIIGKVDGYSEEKNRNKYISLVSTDTNKEVLIKFTKIWNRVKILIKKINDKPGDYDEKYIKNKFNSDGYLSLNKILKLRNMTVLIRSVFQEDNRYYPQVFWDKLLNKL